MESIERAAVPVQRLVGRNLQMFVGRGAALESTQMTVGVAAYSPAAGKMEPHRHAEETIYILEAENAWVRYGPAPDDLPHRIDLKPGVILHIPESEWHVFEWAEGGHADALVIYGTVELAIYSTTTPT